MASAREDCRTEVMFTSDTAYPAAYFRERSERKCRRRCRITSEHNFGTAVLARRGHGVLLLLHMFLKFDENRENRPKSFVYILL